MSIVDAHQPRARAQPRRAAGAKNGVGRAQGARWRALSDLLPNVNGRVARRARSINLAAFGFPLPVGHSADRRAVQRVRRARLPDRSRSSTSRALNDARAEAHNVAAAQHSLQERARSRRARRGNAYLQALAASARADAARAQRRDGGGALQPGGRTSSRAASSPASTCCGRRCSSTPSAARPPRRRTSSRRRSCSWRASSGCRSVRRSRSISELPAVPDPDMTLEEAVERAYKTRPDYQAALERVQAAEAARAGGRSAKRCRRCASTPTTATSACRRPTRTAPTPSPARDVPIFQGGRTGRLLEADADLRSRRAEAEDLKAAIYYEVRTAFLDLQASSEQLQVATQRARAGRASS